MKARNRVRTVAVAAALMLATAALSTASSTAAWADHRPDAPTNVRATQVEPDTFTVAWDAVDANVFYVVERFYVRSDGSRVSVSRARVYEGLTRTFQYNVEWGATYEVTVRARTRVSPVVLSPRSEPATVTTPLPEGYEPPSAPTNMRVAERNARGETTLIRWDAPAHGTEPLDYTLTMVQPALPPGSQTITSFSADTTFETGRIPINVGFFDEPGLTVTLWVTANDKAGEVSPRSEPIHLTCCPY